MSVGSRIKELRESQSITRSQLADMLGVTVGAISNYENEVSSPKEPILFKMMEVLQCDANYLFQDAAKMSPIVNHVTIKEYEHIKKYRDLDSHGKEMVDFTLDKEWERSISEKERKAEQDHILPLAAHKKQNVDADATQSDVDYIKRRKAELDKGVD